MELQRKLLQSRNTRLRLHNCWKGFEVVLFFLLVNNCIDFRSLAGIAFLQDIKRDKSTCMCRNELFD